MLPPMITGWPDLAVGVGQSPHARGKGARCALAVHEQLALAPAVDVALELGRVVVTS